MHDTHAQHGADGVENGEHGALVRIIGQNRLTGSGAGSLEGIADNPDGIDQRKEYITQPHGRLRNERREYIEGYHADGHYGAANHHKGTEFADFCGSTVHQGTDDRVGNGVEHTHECDHDGGIHAELQHAGSELGYIGKNQNKIDIGSTVVQGE